VAIAVSAFIVLTVGLRVLVPRRESLATFPVSFTRTG